MTLEEQKKAADNFPETFEEFELNMLVSRYAFANLDRGIFSAGMTERWHMFTLDNHLYFANFFGRDCFYKIKISRHGENVLLEKAFVAKTQFNPKDNDLGKDARFILEMLDVYLERDKPDTGPEFQLPLVKQILSQYEPRDKYTRNISWLQSQVHKEAYRDREYLNREGKMEIDLEKSGWKKLHRYLVTLDDEEEVLTLSLMDKETRKWTTYYFDRHGREVIAHIG